MIKFIRYIYPGEIKNELLISLLFTILLVFVPLDYLAILPVMVLVLFCLIIYKEKFLIVYSIITLLTITTTINPVARTFVQISDIFLLGYFFLKNYGFKLKEYPVIPFRITAFFSALLGLMILSSINSDFYLGIAQTFRLSAFIIIVYFLYSLCALEKNNYKLIIKSFFFISIIYALYLLYDFADAGFNLLQYNLKMVEYFGNEYLSKNFMGNFFSIIITFSICYLFYFKKALLKYSLAAVIIFSVFSLIVLNSRTSFLTALIALFYITFVFNKKIFKRFLVGLALALLLLVFSPVYELFEIYFRLEKISTGRDAILLSTLNVIKENWLLGAGPAGTKFQFYKNIPYMLGSPIEQFLRFHYNEIEFGHAHNFYLFFFSDLGIFGFILSLVLPALFFGYCNKALKGTVKYSFEYCTVIGILASGLCMFIRGIFEWGGLISYGTITSDLPFWLMFVILILFNKNKQLNHRT